MADMVSPLYRTILLHFRWKGLCLGIVPDHAQMKAHYLRIAGSIAHNNIIRVSSRAGLVREQHTVEILV
jgi:hypothetical protein